MQYHGGKYLISRRIGEIFNEMPRWEIEHKQTDFNRNFEGGYNLSCNFVSLFCGACSIESKLKGFNRIICNDKNEYLIAMFNGVKNGYELPDYISEEQYKYIRDHKDEDKVLTGFVGFGCSFGGKWFAGYAHNKSNRNYAAESKKSLMKDIKGLMNAEFISMDYRDVVLPDGCIVYADPPYAGTTQYNREVFDSEAFWRYMREISKNHIVYISEQKAPEDFVSVWEKQVTRTLDVNKNNQFKVTEKLFVYKDVKEKLDAIRE